jgi:hypothetical protein
MSARVLKGDGVVAAHTIRRVTSIVVLRVRNPGPEASRLLRRLESELGVLAQPQTAGFVPISVGEEGYDNAVAAVTRVLDQSDAEWREHLELRS